MRKKLVAGNWKMHMLSKEAVNFVAATAPRLAGKAMVFAPYTVLREMACTSKGSLLQVGAQNMHFEEKGAFTGEISAEMLLDLGVEATLIGHSERRMYFGENDESVSKKALTACRHGITPVICCGEGLDVDDPQGFVASQIVFALEHLDAKDVANVIIAYEPIWAIGTGKTATPDDANNMIVHLRKTVRAKYGDAADQVRILYGGSVKPSNIADFLKYEEIDGALVGGASLDPDSFLEMVRIASKC